MAKHNNSKVIPLGVTDIDGGGLEIFRWKVTAATAPLSGADALNESESTKGYQTRSRFSLTFNVRSPKSGQVIKRVFDCRIQTLIPVLEPEASTTEEPEKPLNAQPITTLRLVQTIPVTKQPDPVYEWVDDPTAPDSPPPVSPEPATTGTTTTPPAPVAPPVKKK